MSFDSWFPAKSRQQELVNACLLSPADGAAAVDGSTVTFRWSMLSGADYSYRLYLSQDQDFGGCVPGLVRAPGEPVYLAGLLFVLFTCTVDSPAAPAAKSQEFTAVQTVLDSAAAYYWKVEAFSGADSAYSEVWHFTTQ